MTSSSFKTGLGRNLFIVCASIVLASCTLNIGGTRDNGGSESQTEITGSDQASEVSIVDTTSMSVDFGQRYLEIVNDVNCTVLEIDKLEKENSLGDGTFDPVVIDDVLNLYERLSSFRERAVRELLSESWLIDVADEIELIARDWTRVARQEQFISATEDLGQYSLALSEYLQLQLSGNPGFVRAQLGVGPSSETNKC